ncbi:hypothetical protein N7470_000191 [Penicillium chermesinum]|nr:hypothetical protein N7470_000191 [Penicillium chermesinum]
MKASFVTLALAMGAAAPYLYRLSSILDGVEGLVKNLKIGDLTSELGLNKLPVVSTIGDLTNVLGLPAGEDASKPAAANGHLVQDLGPQLQNVLTIAGPDVSTLLIELSPEVTGLVSGLGLPALGVPLGSIVASASGLGGLVTGLGPHVNGLVTVVGADVVAGLLSGLGLPAVGVPVGTVIATLGKNLKRGEIVKDLTPAVGQILTVTGPNAKQLLVELSPSVTALLSGLGLPSVGVPAGEVVKTAGSVGDLVSDLAGPTEGLLTVVHKDGSALLIKLSPEVAQLVTGLGLPSVATPVGAVVQTLGENL